MIAARPARPWSPMAAAAAIVGTWWLVAHNSGSGWVQVLGDLVFGALLIGIVGPPLVLTRARIRLITAPGDGMAGQPLRVGLESSTRLRVRPVSIAGADEHFIGPVRGERSGEGHIVLVPNLRGLHNTLVLEVASAAPFGLQWWHRRLTVPLPSTLHVAPRLGPPIDLPPRLDEASGDGNQRRPTDIGEPRGVRPYRPGDNRRLVHWPLTAHAGELMVREPEGPTAPPVTVTVALPEEAEYAERVAERALGTVVRILDRGSSVVLETTESTGPITAIVHDRRTAGRRLARAVTSAEPAGVSVQR